MSFFWSSPFLFPCPFSEAPPSCFHVLFLKLPLPVSMSFFWSSPFLFLCPSTPKASLPVSMSTNPRSFPFLLPCPPIPSSFPFLFPCPPTPGQQPSLFELVGSFLHDVVHHSRAQLPAESVEWWGNHRTQQAFLNPGESAAFTQFPGVPFSPMLSMS